MTTYFWMTCPTPSSHCASAPCLSHQVESPVSFASHQLSLFLLPISFFSAELPHPNQHHEVQADMPSQQADLLVISHSPSQVLSMLDASAQLVILLPSHTPSRKESSQLAHVQLYAQQAT